MDEDVSNLFTPTAAPPPPPPLGGQVATDWVPPIDPASYALHGLHAGQRSAILDAVPVEQVVGLAGVLTSTPTHANTVRLAMLQFDWFPKTGRKGKPVSKDTQFRRIRTIARAAVALDYPVVTDNEGYWLGDVPALRAGAGRCRRQGYGCFERADDLDALADKRKAAGLP